MRFLIDGMFPPATGEPLSACGHDPVHVRHRGVDARPDPEVAAVAAREDRALVTENVKDFVGEHGLVIVCVLKSRLRQKGMAEHLAATLDAWAQAHPDPYLGLHWPKVSPRRR